MCLLDERRQSEKDDVREAYGFNYERSERRLETRLSIGLRDSIWN